MFAKASITIILGITVFGNMIPFGSCGIINTANNGSGQNDFPPGSIQAFAGPQAPMGWLVCNGSEISRQTYHALFDVITILYGGGDGVSTFNLPDLRGRVLVGAGQGLGLTNHLLATTFGAEQHTLNVNEMPSHSHGVNDPGHQHEIGDGSSRGQRWGINDGGSKWVSGNEHRDFQNNPPTLRAPSGISIQVVGSNTPHNNMQPSIALNYIIKY